MRRLLPGLLLAIVVVGCGSTPAGPTVAPSPSVAASASAVAVVTPTPVVSSPTPAPASPTPDQASRPPATTSPAPESAAPTPTPACLAAQLRSAVTGWEGTAGHQLATVTLTNHAATPCTVQGTPALQLVDAAGVIVIDSEAAGTDGLPRVDPGDEVFVLDPGSTIGTMVQVGDYCGTRAPVLPTTIAFVLPSDAGRVVAAPGPGGGVPGCMSSPGSPGSIEMNGWVR